MRLLVYEFITGGGLIGAPLPSTLLREGAMMRDALLRGLSELPELQLSLTRDPRCAWPLDSIAIERIEIRNGESPDAYFERALQNVNVVWPIAPESGRALERLATLARAAGKQVMLSDAATLSICASKFETARVLQSAGVNVVETCRAFADVKTDTGKFVSKPDCGSGGEGIRLWANSGAAFQALPVGRQYSWVVQPWCEGETLSLSLLCLNGVATLLSVNRQHLQWNDGGVALTGITVNAYSRHDESFRSLAQEIARALAGLWGYSGVDFIRESDGTLRVLEINSRLTTSYCGLDRALGLNVSECVIRMAQSGSLPMLEIPIDQSVFLDLAAANV